MVQRVIAKPEREMCDPEGMEDTASERVETFDITIS
jgi:hypothetical protein